MWCDVGGPGWSRSVPFQAGPCVSTRPPGLERSRPACGSHPNQVLSLRRQKGTCVLTTLEAGSRGEEVGLDSSSPPSVPTSNLNPGTSVDGISKQAQAGVKKEGTPGLTKPEKGPDPRSPKCPLCSTHCPGYLMVCVCVVFPPAESWVLQACGTLCTSAEVVLRLQSRGCPSRGRPGPASVLCHLA